MRSDQIVKRNGQVLLQMAAGATALLLASGCQFLTRGDKAEAAAAPLAARAPATEQAAPDNAITAAIARADSGAPAEAMPAGQPVVVNTNAPASYTVKRGDTLWDISAMYLRDPWLWPELWHANPTVQNPHLIYPGDQLTLAYGANGQPQLQLSRAPGNGVRVQPLIRSTSIEGPIATIPYEAIRAFLGRPGVLSKDEIRSAPHIAAVRDRHLIAAAGRDVYIKGLENHNPGRYSVLRAGDPLKDPETGKVLGYMAIYAGAARVDAIDKVSKGLITDSSRESLAGDLLFAEDMQSTSADIFPHAPPAGLDGQIMAVVDGVSLIGQYQVVAINRGSSQGLESGHVLAIHQLGEVVPDASCKRSGLSWCLGKNLKLPDERAGTMLVFKTYPLMSYGLIVGVTVPVKIADRVRTP